MNVRLSSSALVAVAAMVFLTPSEAFAQGIRAFAGVNAGLFVPATKEYIQSIAVDDIGVEEDDTYRAKNKFIFLPHGGVMFTDMLGVGVAFSFFSSPQPASTRFAVPDDDLEANLTTDAEFVHKQSSVHINFLFKPRMNNENLVIIIFGGITTFSVTQELFTDYSLDFDGVNLTIIEDSIETEEVQESTVGFNLGADIFRMINPNIGVGGTIRFSRGTVDLKDQLQAFFNDVDATVPMKVGGFEASGGVRFFFGSR
jgi:hypothetical protein